ncbi:hypothetical protein MCHLDSM_07321 [Mycolicibacterium chlorophenolicum]|uniref:Uncharacterized protein n=1 Tax=Mycolicibacterium chlorophenolicum TaxID=37916 RepID=A0A0J6VB59_9MYCO|nr:hypothetical protein MCHLDSM_07321 [Mycolicibacterium chlorophenolicum]
MAACESVWAADAWTLSGGRGWSFLVSLVISAPFQLLRSCGSNVMKASQRCVSAALTVWADM